MKNKNFTFFWKGPFSQWHKSDFIEIINDNETKFFCAEQFMMAKKAKIFNDDETYEKIMTSSSPRDIQKFGRTVKNFDEYIWNNVKVSIVFKGNLLKFTQDLPLQNLLIDTGNTMLVEASPYDSVWGIKLAEENPDSLDMNKWAGENLLGKTLTSVREYIKSTNIYSAYFKDTKNKNMI